MDEKNKSNDLLSEVCRNFEEAEKASSDSRAEAEKARDYFDGIQWTAEEKAELHKRKQPCITDNMLKDKIEYMVGLEASSRTDPKAYPRTPNDEGDAEAATDGLRFVAENNDLDTIVSDIAENILVEGMGGCDVVVKPKGDDVEIKIIRNSWDRMYFDPHSRAKNFSDATFRGTFVWMDEDQAKTQWPDVDWDSITESMRGSSGDSLGQTSEDKPSIWYDTSRKRVRVIEQYYKKGGKYYVCKFVKDAWVEKPKESPYTLEGEPDDAYCWMSAYVDRDGNRYGTARRYMDLQDEVNHRRSKALHLMNTNQIQGEEGAFDDIHKARQEASKPDGVLLWNRGFTVNVDKNVELSVGQAQLLAETRQALSITGPKVLGSDAAQSGRAKQIDQQTDVLELGRLFDQLRALKREIYRKIWSRIQQYWTDEKWVRIRDDEGKPKFVQLNKPVTALEYAQSLTEDDPAFQEAVMVAQTNPNQIVMKKNNVAELDVDIILDESPDITTIQAEQFENLVALAGAGVVFPPEVYVEASSLRNKDRLLEKLTGGDDPEQQQAAQQEQQLTTMERMAPLEEAAAKTRKANAEAAQTELENMVGQAAAAGIATQ